MGAVDDSMLKGRMKSNYIPVERIELDALGVTYKCKEKKGEGYVALRVINKMYLRRVCGEAKKDFCFKNIRKEIECLKLLKGEYSINLIDDLETPDYFYFVTELWDTNLEKYTINLNSGLTIREIQDIFAKLNLALKNMFSNDIIHGDLRLSNILLQYDKDNIIPKLSEYGKKILLDDKLKVMHSSTFYSAPELLRGDEYNYKVDLWSLGVILYRLYFNKFPFQGTTQVSIYNQIMKKTNLEKCGENEYFDDLIGKLLETNPNKRIAWDEYFNHEFWLHQVENEDEEESESQSNRYDLPREEVNDPNSGNDFVNKEENANGSGDNENGIDENFVSSNKLKSDSIGKKYNVYYNVNDNETKYEINKYSSKEKLEEFVPSKFSKLKKLEVFIDEKLEQKLIAEEIVKKVQFKNLNKLILYDCDINNIDTFSNVSFINLSELDLDTNEIDNIEVFSKVPFKNLTNLNLSNNRIGNIDVLKRVPFKNLSVLCLNNNKITNFDILAKVPFKNLDKLILSGCGISDLEIFKNVPFKNLTTLDLSNNYINDNSNPFTKSPFNNLSYLDLNHNKIRNIEGLSNKVFQKLTYINLGNNQISEIESLKVAPFSSLSRLFLNDNIIEKIDVIDKLRFSYLYELNLSYNKISNINAFINAPIKDLHKLDLSGNQIKDIEPLTRIELNQLVYLNLSSNDFIEDTNTKELINKIKLMNKNMKLKY